MTARSKFCETYDGRQIRHFQDFTVIRSARRLTQRASSLAHFNICQQPARRVLNFSTKFSG